MNEYVIIVNRLDMSFLFPVVTVKCLNETLKYDTRQE